MEARKTNKIKIKLNDANNLRELLQEAYNYADSQILQAQQKIAELESATNLAECCMDEKQKYAKAINDYLTIKDKAIAKKLDIAKQMSEVLKQNGNVNEMAAQNKEASFDFSKIKAMIDDEAENKQKTVQIELKKEIKK